MGCTTAKVATTTTEPVSAKDKPVVVFVYGGPGSGKGTQCQKIVDAYGFGHISTGELLRAELDNNGSEAEKIENIQREGRLVDSSIVVSLVGKALENRKGVQMIDGFPRNQENLQEWQKQLGKYQVVCLLFLECSEEVMLARLEERSKTSGRADDNEETIKQRIETYQKETKALLDQYHGNQLVTVSADGEPEDIFAEIRFKIEQKRLDIIQAESE